MNMQQIMMQAQKMQRELKKAREALMEKEFSLNKNGMVEVVMYGDKTIKAINIDKDAFDAENKEMVEEAIGMCINEIIEQIDEAEEEINEKITGSKNGGGIF